MAAARRSMRGVLSPVLTPFLPNNGGPDASLFLQHCRWLLGEGVGLAVFGTNSEANSLSVKEKRQLLDHLVHHGKLPPQRLMPGTGVCSLPETVELTRHAVSLLGCGGVLMLPPFYYKGVSDEGLFRYFSTVIDQVADSRLRVYLYHFPQLAGVGISRDLVHRLVRRYPGGTVAGLKDSSGDWDGNTKILIQELGPDGFEVFAGSEALLLATLRAGGAGCISATANVQPGPINVLYETWQQSASGADAQQASLQAVRSVFQAHPLIPAMKAALAHFTGQAEWERLRPPLVELPPAAKASLLQQLKGLHFHIDGSGKNNKEG